jgi:hypothetical protein
MCRQCDKPFKTISSSYYCSKDCRKEAHKARNARKKLYFNDLNGKWERLEQKDEE